MKYEDSGVDIDKAHQATKAISGFVKATWGENVLSEVGQFGGLFRVPGEYDDPVLVSSISMSCRLLVSLALAIMR